MPTVDPFDLTGKVALVTGARRGIGRAAAVALANAGCDVAGLGPNPMSETAEAVAASGRRFAYLACDLAEPNDFDAVLAEAGGHFGPVAILVNNSGIIRRADVLDIAEDDWDAVLGVNLKSVFLLSQAAARVMVRHAIAGRIINVGSVLSFQGGVRVSPYAAAKHGVAGLTRAMASELAPKGITVNAIAPGYFATDNTEALRADAGRSRQILERIPAGRWGEPGDVATTVVFLAAPASAYVTGAIIPVDGGWLAR